MFVNRNTEQIPLLNLRKCFFPWQLLLREQGFEIEQMFDSILFNCLELFIGAKKSGSSDQTSCIGIIIYVVNRALVLYPIYSVVDSWIFLLGLLDRH